jgi:hypothetical protein
MGAELLPAGHIVQLSMRQLPRLSQARLGMILD